MYGYRARISGNFEDAIIKVTGALKKEGFGVLTKIDVRETLKEKLGASVDNYVILGACNPPFAYKALVAEPEVGLMLPCNVIVYEREGGLFVSAILPTAAMGMIDNPALKEVAVQVEAKLKKVIDSLN